MGVVKIDEIKFICNRMKELKTTNTLLLIIVIPVIFYLLKILSFIFIPLIFSMFIALLFLPLMRWLKRRKVPKLLSIIVVILVIAGIFTIGSLLIQLSTNEIRSADGFFFEKAETKLIALIESIEGLFGMERAEDGAILIHYLKDINLFENFGSTMGFVGNTISMTLTTAFFAILLLSESINFQELLNTTLFKHKHTSVRTFRQIEKDLIKFVWVKFVLSLITGIGFTLACIYFDISFPIFWGLFAFIINFVQMIGSIISVALLSLFAFIEIEPTGTLLFFILVITAVQALTGGVLEPILMGKTFSINVVTVLVMLMLWGFIWGVPGLILSIPITVFIKIILEQFPKTRAISNLMSGPVSRIKIPIKEN